VSRFGVPVFDLNANGATAISLRIGMRFPISPPRTTDGEIRFHEWDWHGWAVLFSHPNNFTPLLYPELVYLAQLKPTSTTQHKVIGLSIDRWKTTPRWAGGHRRDAWHALITR